MTPRATMRLQFHLGFTFSDARSLAAYFAALGVSHIYASPIMTARTGSIHGYDVVDPTRVNPELGGEDELRKLVEELRRHELGLMVDIVPNHMAASSDNAWWVDVLARGRGSRYAKYFDIDWSPPNSDLRDKVLVPVLGRPYGEALDAGEITLARDDGGSAFVIRYFDHVFPVAPDEALANSAVADFDPASSAGRARLHTLLERQHYRLSWWRVANDEINWRRFFDINDLVAVRVEDDEVFEAVHATLFRLYAEGLIDGLRVDHIDGLSQPGHYCRKLRERLRTLEHERPRHAPDGPAYVVVEKILGRNESLPAEWQTDGTTGYDFMDEVSALLHDVTGERPLREAWHRISGRPADFDTEEEIARRQILEQSFSAQRDAAVDKLHATAQSRLTTRDYSRAAIRRCLTEILVHFPVYRVYARVDRASPMDRAFLAQAVAQASATCLPSDAWLVKTLGEWLSGMRINPGADTLQNVALARFEQLSAPLCAKAVEDTAFYRYGRLISRSDVGFDVRQFAWSAADFHRKMQTRAAALPHAMLATATHDHKRGEDVRARIAVLSEIPDDWARAVEQWIALSAPHCATAEGALMPSAGDLAILFQMVVGAWPHRLTPSDRPGLIAYSKRIAAWQQKAVREAKLRSDWTEPNVQYERAATDFVTWLFAGPSELLNEIANFAQRIAPAGAANGLTQALVKLTAPGVPDIYQGTEYWDLSLVDPDNRSPVDFAVRQRTLAASSVAELAEHWIDGRIKQLTIARVLAMRKEMPRLFSDGDYLPLETRGPLEQHIFAFARTWQASAAIVICCRHTMQLTANDDWRSIPYVRCNKTVMCIPPALRGIYSDTLTPDRTLSIGADVEVSRVLDRLPIAVLAK